MKLAGILILIISSTAAGVYVSDKAHEKVLICRELLQLCDMLTLDMSFRNTPLTELVNGFSFKRLDFLTINAIKNKGEIKSPLSKEENEEISLFLYSLGKTDSHSQLKLIESFKEYINAMMKKYNDLYIKNARLYITFGFFFGTVVSLALA